MLLFYDGAHGEPVKAVAATLRVHVATQIEVQVATVRIGVRTCRPILAVGIDAVQRLPVTVASSREKNGVSIGFAGYTIATMTTKRHPSPCTLV